jgi:hypothetical protein
MLYNKGFDLESKIKDFVNNSLKGEQKLNAHWSIRIENGTFYLAHYGTEIVSYNGQDIEPIILGGIWNSVSDVQGVNKFISAFGLPFHYSGITGLTKQK